MASTQAPTLANGRFLVEARLGEGGQAAVFRVRDQRLGVERALKVLLPKFADRPRVRERFAAEARAMAGLEHPHIVRVYDVEVDGTTPYMVMELMGAGSIAQYLETYGSFPPRQAVHVALQMCAGAGEAHRAHIIHRDLKPQNVLVGLDGVCKITDFGIARLEDGHRTRVGSALGTQGYMAPEQARDATKVDPRADVYSIGVTLFVLLTCTDPMEWLSGRARDAVPEALRAVMERATHPRVNHRYGTTTEFAAALESALAELPPDPVRVPLGRELPCRSKESMQRALDWSDLVHLLDGGGPDPRDTYDSGTSTYAARPQPADAVNTPEWVDRSARARTPRPFEIHLDTQERRASRHAARARGDTSPDLFLASTGQDRGWVDAIGRWGSPWHLLGIAAFALLLAGVFLWSEGGPGGGARSTPEARLDEALGEERGVIDALAGLGADRIVLDEAYRRWQRSTGVEKHDAALALVDALDRASEAVAQPGSPQWENAHKHVRRLRVAGDASRRETTPPPESWSVGFDR